ncbi:MAG: hypothetical protein FWD84_04315 [Oscillospiraceae bacterium]|nr:hypothetical protein [Oscillospiraceae bacterium]
MKRLLAFLLVLILVAGLAACDGTTPPEAPPTQTTPGTSATGTGNILDERTVSVVILRHSWTDFLGTAIMRFVDNVITPEFNITVELMTIGSSTAEDVVAGTENAVAAGADIILTATTAGLEASCRIAQQAGVAFGVVYAHPTVAELERLQQFDNWIGSVGIEMDSYQSGRSAAEQLIADGHDNFAIVSWTHGLLPMADRKVEGFLSAIHDAGRNVVFELYEMPGPGMIVAISTMLQIHGREIEYIIAQGGGMGFVGPALTQSDMVIPTYSSSLPDDFEAFFDAGLLNFISTFNNTLFAFSIVQGINFLNGTPLPGTPELRLFESSEVILRTVEQTREFVEKAYGPTAFTLTADELRSIIVAYNPEATFADLVFLLERVDLRGIVERLG